MHGHACIEPTVLHQESMKSIIKKHDWKMKCMQTTSHRWGERTWQLKGPAHQLEPRPKQASTQQKQQAMLCVIFVQISCMHACVLFCSAVLMRDVKAVWSSHESFFCVQHKCLHLCRLPLRSYMNFNACCSCT